MASPSDYSKKCIQTDVYNHSAVYSIYAWPYNTGEIRKEHINRRGYSEFLQIEWAVVESIDKRVILFRVSFQLDARNVLANTQLDFAVCFLQVVVG